MCSLRIPNCPHGFEWIQNFDNISCFKTFGQTVTFFESSIESGTVREINSFWINENECSKLGSRLAVIESTSDFHNISPWLHSKHGSINSYMLGMKINAYSSPMVSYTSTNRSVVIKTICFYRVIFL